MDDQNVSDEILVKAKNDLQEFIEKNNIPKEAKMMLETQYYILLVSIQDHQRVNKMYPVFKKQQERGAWWDKFQWVIIPIVTGGALAFVWQAFVFWFDIVPKLNHLP